jgi:hypothetical protein
MNAVWLQTLAFVAIAALGCAKDQPAASAPVPVMPALPSAPPETAAPVDASVTPVASVRPSGDAGTAWLVFHRGALQQECQSGGDSCIAPTEWHVVRMPFAQ